MAFRSAFVFTALAFLLLPACGGGGGSDGVTTTDALNLPEKELVGGYELVDFTIFEAGTPPCDPGDFEVWEGLLELREDRTAHVAVELCEHAGQTTSLCDREFTWSADAGLIHLYSVDPQEPDVLMHWTSEGMGGMRTESVLPTNDPGCSLFLVSDGFETLDWLKLR